MRFDTLSAAMPDTTVYYAVKANAHNTLLTTLIQRGSSFDVASRYEIDQLVGLGVSSGKMSFGNTIKKEVDIAYAYAKGVRTYASDSLSDIQKLSRAAPGASVMLRLLLTGGDADVPLSRKFGADKEMTDGLIMTAAAMGLRPIGVTFHVGSQQREISAWREAIVLARQVFDVTAQKGIELSTLNLGGGFPAQYLKPTSKISDYAAGIYRFLEESFGDTLPKLVIEPGRYIAGDAGVIASEVVMVSRKAEEASVRWVYLDVGKFNGLMETLDEGIKYRIHVEKKCGEVSTKTSPAILAGPSCDSADILYEKFKYELPDNLEEGDRIYFLSAGAYSASMSTVGFNGFPPLQTYILE